MFDSTLPILLGDGYEFIRDTCDRLGTDFFETRFLLRRAVCVLGADAARMFYDERLLQRRGAIPGRVLSTLFGKGGVHGLDGEVHRQRKRMFMRLMTEDRLARLERISRQEWELAADRWKGRDEVILHEGEPLLIVDSRIASDLDGAELDYETGEADDPRRAGFRLRPPTA